MSAVYPKFREKLVQWAIAGPPPAGLAFYMIGVDATYVYSAAHVNLANVSAPSILAPEHLLDVVTYVDGIVDAADEAYTGLTLAAVLDAAIIYLKDGAGASYLAAYIDSSTDGSMPAALSSTSATFRWNASGIFKA